MRTILIAFLVVATTIMGCLTTPEPLGKSISIGMSQGELVQKLGEPNDVRRITDESGFFEVYTYWHWDSFWGWQKEMAQYIYLFNGQVVKWSE